MGNVENSNSLDSKNTIDSGINNNSDKHKSRSDQSIPNVTAVLQRSKLTDIRRQQLVVKHRISTEEFMRVINTSKSNLHDILNTTKPPRSQSMPRSLANLVTLKINDIDLTKDKVYNVYPYS